MNDKPGRSPEVMAGVAMAMARERAELRENAEEASERSEVAQKGGVVTALIVVAVLIGTLTLMLLLGK